MVRRATSSWLGAAAAACTGVLLAAGAAGATLRDAPLRLLADGPEDAVATTRHLARLSQGWLDRLLGPEAPAETWLRIRFGADLPPATSVLALHLPPTVRVPELAHRLVLLQLRRRALLLQPGTAPGSMDWLAAGVVNRLLSAPAPDLVTRPDLVPFTLPPGTPPPRLAQLLASPVPPDLPLAYPLYARYCDLLLGVLERAGRGPDGLLVPLVELQAAGREPFPALQFLLTGRLQPGDDEQSWFAREALTLARLQRRTARAEDVAARVRDLQRLAAVVSGTRGTVVTQDVTLEQLAAGDAEYQPSREELDRLYRDFFDLLRSAPPLLQPPLQEYMQAVEALARDEPRTFRRALRRAQQAFPAALTRQQEVEEYLNSLTQNVAPSPAPLLQMLLPLAAESRARQRALHPALQEYLDGLEEK